MTPTQTVMMLIDADNVSPDVIEQALGAVLAAHGAAHVRRAYGTAEAAAKNAALFKRLAIRPIVNLASGKNSTDIAMAVDAIDLVVAERPGVVVIVSSDSDFAPLVIRLREKGCRVCGIGQAGKTGEEVVHVYDEFTEIAHRKPASRAVAARAPARRGARQEAMAPSLPPAAQADAPLPKPRRRSSKAPPPPASAASDAAASELPSTLPDAVLRVLAAVPKLRDGAPMELGIAAERLRSSGLLAKNAPSTKLFKKHPELFTLTPERQPNRVQYCGPSAV